MLSGLENPFHILIICLVILLVFGAKRLPEMGRSLGTGMREFKSGLLNQGDASAPRTPHEDQATRQPEDSPTDRGLTMSS